MAYIENGKYQSSAAMGSSCQEMSSGLLLDKTGITILKKNEFISWDDLYGGNARFVKPFTSPQLSAINHYRAKYLNRNSDPYFIVLATMPGTAELTQYTLKGDIAQGVLSAYNKHRYVDPTNPVELNADTEDSHYSNFDLLDKFVRSYLEGRTLQIPHPQADNIKIKITVSQVYIYSIPTDDTKPLYTTRRGTRSKNRGKKK